MDILGISAFYHDSAACLVRDGEIVAAAQEERFSREKHDPSFPEQAIGYCLSEGDVAVNDLDEVVFYEKPWLKFERLLETYLSFAPVGIRSFLKAMPLWLKKKLWLAEEITERLDYEDELLFTKHHHSHAASTFFPSPFDEAAILTLDGVGGWTTTGWGIGEHNHVELQRELRFPHSLGLLYSAFTYYTGFRVESGEYKVMGLAPYGEPRYVDTILNNLMDLRDDGSFRLNMDYFNYCQGLTMTSARFHRLFGGERREPESELRKKDVDLARSIQVVTEKIILRMARHVRAQTGKRNLCLAGGVALNCVANGKLLRSGIFDNLWIQPAAGDAGGALGAALTVWHQHHDGPRSADGEHDQQQGSFLGPGFSDDAIQQCFDNQNLPYQTIGYDAIPDRTAALIEEGNVVGWFQGRMEYGPRALGGRSILADPRRAESQRTVNQKIKFREDFRPFAPSVLEERVDDYFELESPSPYMLLVAQVRNADIQGEGFDRLHNIHSPVPAVTHVDGSARIQTVDQERHPLYYRLLNAFEQRTGCPVLVNTSFNVRGEPIVCTPEDALTCFQRTHMDAAVLGPYLVTKDMVPDAEQRVFSKKDIEDTYGLD